MKCRHCEGEHMAKDCPTYVPICKNCNQEGKYMTETFYFPHNSPLQLTGTHCRSPGY